MIYVVKTIVGRESIVLDSISAKSKSENLDIKGLFYVEEIKGYVFVEGEIKDIEKAVKMMPNVRGIIKKPIDVNELKRFLEPKKIDVEINVGDLVEIIGGPFKTMKGKVTRYDKIKREVTIEPLETTVPIPVTISVEFVKILEKSSA